ncbi:hypothetical protein QWZ08_14230 [Ferruginibacter paludis]|uniref:hypothetical protein n=1 Tax=Ferruginibacter paludis TaxID=1310417 RepID=UPI0025B50387|nr:hypothetical protein [Ferruginibacter paludis]MDN3656800.1 hypothetical protein [Ferruginibacter paludis]
METHADLTDKEFETQFKNCALSPDQFNHEAHLRLAWIHIRQYGTGQAIENICNQLNNFTRHAGAADKYNVTLTIASIKAVAHFIKKTDTANFNDFIMQVPRLKYDFKELMACHYSQDIYNADIARKEFIEPDLLPFE